MTIKADGALYDAIVKAMERSFENDFLKSPTVTVTMTRSSDGICAQIFVRSDTRKEQVYGSGPTTDEALIALARAVVQHTAAQADSRNALMALLHEPTEVSQ